MILNIIYLLKFVPKKKDKYIIIKSYDQLYNEFHFIKIISYYNPS